MTTLTNEQIIEGMAYAYFTRSQQPDSSLRDGIEAVITYLSSIGYQITRIEPDDAMNLFGLEAEANGGYRSDIFKAMSAAGRVKVEEE